jgi:hypothetical protein
MHMFDKSAGGRGPLIHCLRQDLEVSNAIRTHRMIRQ